MYCISIQDYGIIGNLYSRIKVRTFFEDVDSLRNVEQRRHETLPIFLLVVTLNQIAFAKSVVIANDCWKMQSVKVKRQFSHLTASVKMIIFPRLVGF